eukprot:TRINITY_DN323_c0_g1_i1.p1 TRINITY_DN323_c0_g1~~TRINITY_DN323_c0_g1_i1.p1  ORF type:complete len:194 (-),score=29.07 TRINITY_DN323_c0_g1_i1:175-756(-)
MGFEENAKFQPLEVETTNSVREPTVTFKLAHINYFLFFLIFGFGCAVFVMNTTLLSVSRQAELVAPIMDIVFAAAITLTCISGCLYSKFYKTAPCFLCFYGFLAAGTLLFLVAVIVIQLISALNPRLLTCHWYCYSRTQPIIGFITFAFLVTIGVLLLIVTGTTIKMRKMAAGAYSRCASSSSSCSSTDSSSC